MLPRSFPRRPDDGPSGAAGPPRGIERLTDLPLALAVGAAGNILARAGPRRAYRFARFLGDVWYRGAPGRRRIALRNLEIAFGGALGPAERERIARESCHHAMATAADVFLREKEVTAGNWPAVVALSPEVEALLASPRPRGLILLGGHLGDWEMIPHLLALQGLPVACVARTIHNPHLDRLATRMRSRGGATVVPKAGALREVWRVLRAGGAAGLVVDQSAPLEEGFEEFFGAAAATYTSWARLAARARPRIAFIACIREGFDFRFRIGCRVLDEPIEATGGEDARPRAIVRAYLGALEEAIRGSPEQYLWMHRRWKRRPPGEPDLYADC
jgi:KDO2-lipid IV(A) lauroyltransferase